MRVMIQKLAQGPHGISLTEVMLQKGATIGEAVDAASWNFLGYSFLVNGRWASLGETLSEGDSILMVPEVQLEKEESSPKDTQQQRPQSEEEIEESFLFGQIGMHEYVMRLEALVKNDENLVGATLVFPGRQDKDEKTKREAA